MRRRHEKPTGRDDTPRARPFTTYLIKFGRERVRRFAFTPTVAASHSDDVVASPSPSPSALGRTSPPSPSAPAAGVVRKPRSTPAPRLLACAQSNLFGSDPGYRRGRPATCAARSMTAVPAPSATCSPATIEHPGYAFARPRARSLLASLWLLLRYGRVVYVPAFEARFKLVCICVQLYYLPSTKYTTYVHPGGRQGSHSLEPEGASARLRDGDCPRRKSSLPKHVHMSNWTSRVCVLFWSGCEDVHMHKLRCKIAIPVADVERKHVGRSCETRGGVRRRGFEPGVRTRGRDGAR